MKKIYLFITTALSVVAFFSNTSAQITLTSADMPQIGNKFVNGYDTLPSSVTRLNPGGSGANVSWNFSTLPTSYRDTNIITSVASTPYAASFTTATEADSVYGTPGYNYVADSTNSFTVIGGVQSVQGILATALFTPPLRQLTFPAAYGNTGSGSGTAHAGPFAISYLTLDSAKATIVTTYADTMDAWGSITTPLFGGSTYNTLRQKHFEVDIDSLFVHNSASKTWALFQVQVNKMYQYRWYANGIGDLVGLMTLDSTDKKVSSMEWYDGYPDGVNEVSQQHSAIAFPNPCTDQINFNYSMQNAAYINVFDVTGRQLSHNEMRNGRAIVVTNKMEAGIYLYSVTDVNGKALDNGKFTVAR